MGKVKKLIAAAMISVMSLSVVGCKMIEQTAESKAKTVLAKVGDTNITLGDVDAELKADIDNLKQTYGQDYESSIPDSLKEQLKTVRTQVLNQLVNEQIMSQKAKALNLIPSDEYRFRQQKLFYIDFLHHEVFSLHVLLFLTLFLSLLQFVLYMHHNH